MFCFASLRPPLRGTGRTLDQFPLITKEHVKVAHIPPGGIGLPCSLDSAGCSVHTLTGAVAIGPAQALLLDESSFGFGSDQLRISRAMGFAERMSAGNKSHGFLIVHTHPRKGLTHIAP